MSITEELLVRLKELPEDKQREVLEFADSLVQQNPPHIARRSLEGLWRGLNSRPITDEDVREARQEMWGRFPREPSE
jgi:Protein of unknown function (DUF2281).